MAQITQRGVDRYTQALRDRFDAENKEFDRQQRLKDAAAGRTPGMDDPRTTAVKLERARQQAQDISDAEQSVRKRYMDGNEFQGSQRLFDAPDVSILPEAVLAKNGGGRLAPSELVRMERDRVNGSGDWTPEDDFYAGHALGSRKMVDSAVETAATARAAQLLDQNKLAQADYADNLRARRARRDVNFDIATARGLVPGAIIKPSDYAFGSGGTMTQGSAVYNVPMGIGQGRTFQPEGFGAQPAPVIDDQTYQPSSPQKPKRTGAAARTATFEPSPAPTDSSTYMPKRGWDY